MGGRQDRDRFSAYLRARLDLPGRLVTVQLTEAQLTAIAALLEELASDERDGETGRLADELARLLRRQLPPGPRHGQADR